MSEIFPPLVCQDAPNKLRLYGGKVVGVFFFLSAVKKNISVVCGLLNKNLCVASCLPVRGQCQA